MNDFDKFFIGYDNILKMYDDFASNLPKYPFYNIKKLDENKYAIEMAVAGFGKSNIDITLADNKLIIKGLSHTDEKDEEYLYRGISQKPFTRMFALSDQVQVNSSELVNGILKIYLEKMIPEEKKPKKIEVNYAL
jgi:molecular chaperone IbpA